MAEEERAARAVEVAGQLAAGGASLVPIAGGPLSVAIAYFSGGPLRRYQERILQEIREDIEEFYRFHHELPARLLETDEFTAALFRTVRYAQETGSTDKRAFLRHALINGYLRPSMTDSRDRYLDLVAKYDPGHVLTLRAIVDLTAGETTLLSHAVRQVSAELAKSNAAAIPVETYLRDLVTDGLVTEQNKQEIRQRPGMSTLGGSAAPPELDRYQWHFPSARGQAFLKYIKDPMEPEATL